MRARGGREGEKVSWGRLGSRSEGLETGLNSGLMGHFGVILSSYDYLLFSQDCHNVFLTWRL